MPVETVRDFVDQEGHRWTIFNDAVAIGVSPGSCSVVETRSCDQMAAAVSILSVR